MLNLLMKILLLRLNSSHRQKRKEKGGQEEKGTKML